MHAGVSLTVYIYVSLPPLSVSIPTSSLSCLSIPISLSQYFLSIPTHPPPSHHLPTHRSIFLYSPGLLVEPAGGRRRRPPESHRRKEYARLRKDSCSHRRGAEGIVMAGAAGNLAPGNELNFSSWMLYCCIYTSSMTLACCLSFQSI